MFEFIPQQKKYKILAFSDHAMSTSGVGTQSRWLFNGLVSTGKYTIRQFGGAIKHDSYEQQSPHPDIIIKPIDGFGNIDLLRTVLIQEKPDVLFLFTDPRFFMHVFSSESEVHQFCPIAYWNIWDNWPAPKFNKVLYDSCDLLNCISYPTYEMVKSIVSDTSKVHYVPHALPKEIYYPLPKDQQAEYKRQLFRNRKVPQFVGLWVNRNARRKNPNDLLMSWKMFVDELEKKHGHRDAVLVLHTDPNDNEGPNLHHNVSFFELENNVVFSNSRIAFEDMNKLYSCCDFVVNISLAEGFGLGTLEAMQCGKPIIVQKTGGMTRQVVDHRDGSENGIGLDPELTTLVGSQSVPVIKEDFVSHETIKNAFMKMYEMGPDERDRLGQKARDYVLSEFNINDMIRKWDETLEDTIKNWREKQTKFVISSY